MLHHIERPRRFLAEAERVLKPGGRIILVEPAITPVSGLFYRHFHPEPVMMAADPLADGPLDPNREPFDANQAVPTLLFGRHRKRFEQMFPGLRTIRFSRLSLLAYPLSGGFRPWCLVPTGSIGFLLRLEMAAAPVVGSLMAFRLFVVIEKVADAWQNSAERLGTNQAAHSPIRGRPPNRRMRRAFQKSILFAYRVARSTGLLSTTWGRGLSEGAYSLYKNLFEPGVDHLRSLVHPGASIVDVGANVGFFTLKFAKWVSDGGRVIAIEPEPGNLDALNRAISRSRAANIDVIQAAAAEKEGELFLSLNPLNPADHRLAEKGIPIRAITIDGLLQERGWPPVSLIKIDVQGAEPRTLAGARETISRFHPAIFIEVDDEALGGAGFSADPLIDSLRSQGYKMYGSEKGAVGTPLSNDDARLRRRDLGYADFVFIH